MFWVVASVANRERGVSEGSLDRAGLTKYPAGGARRGQTEHVQLTADLHELLHNQTQAQNSLRPEGQIQRAVWRPALSVLGLPLGEG